MRKILLFTLALLLIFSMLGISALALTESEVEAQVAAQGKAKVTGNILIWFLCAIAFLKVSQKIDSFMSSLGINVGHTGGSMLAEMMIAFRGIKAASGGAFGRSGSRGNGGGSSGGGSSGGSGGNTTFLSGGLSGSVGRKTEHNAIESVTGRQSHGFSQRMYDSSVQRGGGFANAVIGAVAKGNINSEGTITGSRAAEAMTSYFGYAGQNDAPKYSDMEIGGGRITGYESVGGAEPTEFAMYNTDQYMKPDGEYTIETAADGSRWYKQTPVDSVEITPYMDSDGNTQYNETIVQRLPRIPRRKDKA